MNSENPLQICYPFLGPCRAYTGGFIWVQRWTRQDILIGTCAIEDSWGKIISDKIRKGEPRKDPTRYCRTAGEKQIR